MYASGTAWTTAAEGPTGAAQNAAVAAGTSLSPAVTTADVTVTFSNPAGTVTVSVSYDFQMLTPVLGTAGPLHLTRSVTLPTAPVAGN